MFKWLRNLFKKKRKPTVRTLANISEDKAIRKCNAATINLICAFEGFRAKPYLCSSKVPTIGYGTTYYPDGTKVTLKDTSISEETAKEYFHTNLKSYARSVDNFLKRNNLEKSDNQYGALVSLAYNCGAGVITSNGRSMNKALLKNKGVDKAFMKYVKSRGRTLNGLVRRRRAEVALYNG